VPVLAVRVSFVGEHGWELYADTGFGAALWQTLWRAGSDDGGDGLVACGYRAIESLRLEKGYRVWSTDLTPETTPDEAGLAFCVKLDHPARPDGFHGADAVRAGRRSRADGLGEPRTLACLILQPPPPGEPPLVALGGEPVRRAGTDRVLGRVTSAGYGYSVGASIAYAYLPVDSAAAGEEMEVDLFGRWLPAVVAAVPL
jgi:glycine cleavage system aminomethyltransferase T